MTIKLGDTVLIALSTSIVSGVVKANTKTLRAGHEKEMWTIISWDLEGKQGEVELAAESILVLDMATDAELKAFIETITDVNRARQQASFLKEDIPF